MGLQGVHREVELYFRWYLVFVLIFKAHESLMNQEKSFMSFESLLFDLEVSPYNIMIYWILSVCRKSSWN